MPRNFDGSWELDHIASACVHEFTLLNKKFQLAKDLQANTRLLEENAFYLPHNARRETPEYIASRHELVVVQDTPCLVCGVTHSMVIDQDKQADPTLNPYGATKVETHHYLIEWALANAIDPQKFNTKILPALHRMHPENPDYHHALTPAQIAAWVDHSLDNLWVLCDVHHRHKYLGVHAITHPIWGPQDLLLPAFDKYVRRQVFNKPAKESAGAGG